MLPLGPPDRYRSPYKSRSAFAAFNGLLVSPKAPVSQSEIIDFRDRQAFWIGDWERFAGRNAVADQVRFEREWSALRAYGAERGVRIMGDVAIYVSPGGADHRAHPEIFQEGLVAGAPPDAYARDGQLWGNPLYDWPALQRRGYRWWIERVRRTLELFDLARIDHFRGFVAYWAVPAGARNARGGTWRRGPGRAVFDAVTRELGEPALVAEDLGVITPAVERLRKALGLPGMLVTQFGLDPDDPSSSHRLEKHTFDRVVYASTHDTDTLRGWLESMPDAKRAFVDSELQRRGFAERRPWWALIRLTFSSPAFLAMIQAQDLLGLGSEARMNAPGQAGGSWRWQMRKGALTAPLARRLREVTEEAGRLTG